MLRDDRPSPFRSALKLGLAALVVVAGLPLALAVGGLLDGLGNPFRSDHHERADAAVLTALADLDDLHAATAELQVVVEVEEDTRYLPDIVSGRQTTFLAAGSVDAVVALSAATVVDKGEVVVVTLPRPVLDDPAVDHERSRVLDRDRGAFDRIADAVADAPGDSDVYALAAEELRRAAGETEVLDRAEVNARATITGLLADAGVERVEVVFADPSGASA